MAHYLTKTSINLSGILRFQNYMQKMLFTDNQGSYIVPFTHNTRNCYWSATLDTGLLKRSLLLKVANNKSTPESVNIIIKGAERVDPEGRSMIMSGPPEAENSISDPYNIFPVAGTFNAGTDFNYTFPAYSVTVLRVNY